MYSPAEVTLSISATVKAFGLKSVPTVPVKYLPTHRYPALYKSRACCSLRITEQSQAWAGRAVSPQLSNSDFMVETSTVPDLSSIILDNA